MNNQQLTLATLLYYKSQIFQDSKSQFWDVDGGTHIFELEKWSGVSNAEAEFIQMEKDGYTEITLRKDGNKGVRLTQKAIDEINTIKAQQDAIDKAKAQSDEQIAYEAEVEKIIQTAILLGYKINKT